MRLSRLAFLLLALMPLACDFGSGPAKQPSFIGEWESDTTMSYTRGDSLVRDSLIKHMLARDIDLNRYFDFNDTAYDRPSREEFDRAMNAFSYACEAPFPCDQVIWWEMTKARFTRDSLTGFTGGPDTLFRVK